MTKQIESATSTVSLSEADLLIQKAISAIEQRMFSRGPSLEEPNDVKDYLRLKLANERQEIFGCIFLDSQHRAIAYEHLFYGTIDKTAVYPRIILQRALALNSAAIITAHNHPSGDVTPSEQDFALTKSLRDLFRQLDVRMLDHFIIGDGEPYSFAEGGLI